jgi:hypothetical protein
MPSDRLRRPLLLLPRPRFRQSMLLSRQQAQARRLSTRLPQLLWALLHLLSLLRRLFTFLPRRRWLTLSSRLAQRLALLLLANLQRRLQQALWLSPTPRPLSLRFPFSLPLPPPPPLLPLLCLQRSLHRLCRRCPL